MVNKTSGDGLGRDRNWFADGLDRSRRRSADATTTVAFYGMDESSPATVLIDSNPNHINGTIGTDVTTSIGSAGAIAHRFKDVDPVALRANVEHLDRVPHDARMNPDAADFAVTIRYRTTRSFGNVIQKCQNQTVGGYFKFEAPTGHMTCLFRRVVRQPTRPDLAASPERWPLAHRPLRTVDKRPNDVCRRCPRDKRGRANGDHRQR